MAVTFILGRAGTGKTHHCLSAILAELARPADDLGDPAHTRRLIFLVPEQASFQMERALALGAPRGGFSRAEVLSFSRLARRVFSQTGTEPKVVGAEARGLALRLAVAQCRPHLRALRRASETGGFFAELDRVIEQLLAENIAPDEFAAAASQLADEPAATKVRDLAHIYATYLAWLGAERVDAAARLGVLRDRLAGLAWLPGASIWVDGFAGFTGQELQTLLALARQAREVFITLLLDPGSAAARDRRPPPDPLGLFQRTELTYQRLLGALEEAGVPVNPPLCLTPATPPRVTAAPELTRLELGLATPWGASPAQPAAGGDPGSVRIVECPTHRDELQAAARWIRKSLADSGGTLHYRDFAVIARDLAPFADLVAEVFTEYEIPYFLDRRRPMRAHPLARLVPALFEAVRADFSAGAMVRLLRTRLLPLSRDAAEQLENLLVNHGIAGADLWRQTTWHIEPGGALEAFATERAAIVAALDPLVVAVARAGTTAADWARTLYQVLDAVGVRRQIEGWMADARTQRRWESFETHRLAWTALTGVLEDLHDVLADTPVPAAEAAEIIATALADLTLGLAPPTVDQVLVSSIERSRHPEIQYAWLFAFNEGVFPARPPDDLLLSTAERQALARAGLAAPASNREDALGERLLAYIAVTRPARRLTISYADVGEDGGALLPSPLLPDVLRALPDLRVERMPRCEPPVHVAELAREYLGARLDDRRTRERRRYAQLCTRVQQVPALAGPLSWLLRGTSYANEPPPIGNFRRPRAGGVNHASGVSWRCSPSEIETYLQCAFKHFLRYGLHLDAQRGPQPLRWDLGDIAHEILATVTLRALQEPVGVRAIADERWQSLLDIALREFWERQPPDQAQRRPDRAFLGGLLGHFLKDIVAVHAERWRRGQFEPLACERAFDRSDEEDVLHSVELPQPGGGCVHIRGKIDRIDICRLKGECLLLVYDYKPRAGPVGYDWLSEGRLQLFIYLLAVEQGLATGLGAEPRPAGVFLAPLYPDLAALDKQCAVEATPIEQLMYMYRPRGLVEESAALLLDTGLSRGAGQTTGPSPVAQLQLKKDGSFYTNCDARPARVIQQYLELAAATVLHAADGVCAGRIDIAPLVERRTLACRNCEYAAVCRFDRAYNRPRPIETALPHLDEGRRESEEGRGARRAANDEGARGSRRAANGAETAP